MIDTLFIITLAEAFMGGGGRLIEIGPFTLRMLLFATCLVVGGTAIFFRLRSMDGQKLALGLVFMYLLVHVFGLLVGAVNGADTSDMITEFQQSLYWLAAPFFALVLQSPAMVYRASVIVRISGVVLAITYIAILLLLLTGRFGIVRALVFPLLKASGEVIVRGDSFLFYKGFLYLGISIIFFVAMRGKLWVSLTALVGAALVLTLTRGFVLSVSVAVLLLLFAQGRRVVAGVALIVVVIAAFVVFIYVPSLNKGFMTSRASSITQRQEDLVQIVDAVTPKSLLVGEGYGALVNDRLNIENTFLWALWKLGVAGMMFWLAPLGLCGYFYLKIPDRGRNPVASAFFFGTILIYVQTLTNPYLNNPIGLSFILTAIFSLRTLARHAPPRAQGKSIQVAAAGSKLIQ